MARRGTLTNTVGKTLLTSKLQILTGTGNRRPSIALSILTGRVAEQLAIIENFYAGDPVVTLLPHAVEPVVDAAMTEPSARPAYLARTVYLSDQHLRDIDSLIEVLGRQQVDPKRLNRSAVLRHAIEFLHAAAEADPAKFLVESE